MNPKSIIMTGAIVGSAIGGAVPLLWGVNELSFVSVLLSAVGGIAGIWAGLKISQQ